MASTVSDTNLNFGLIAVAVKLKKVQKESKEASSFSLASKTGDPVKQVYIVEETGELVGTRADCVRGVFDGGGFHLVPEDQITAIDEATKLDSITIDHTLGLAEVPWERIQSIYFIAPGGKGGPSAVKPLALLRDGLKATGKAGIGRLSIRTKSYPFAVYEKDGGLLLATLGYADEFTQIAEAAVALEGVETDAKTLNLAGTLIDQLAGSRADLDAYADDRRALREGLVATAVSGEAIEFTAPALVEAPTADLADLLAASVAAAQEAKVAA